MKSLYVSPRIRVVPTKVSSGPYLDPPSPGTLLREPEGFLGQLRGLGDDFRFIFLVKKGIILDR